MSDEATVLTGRQVNHARILVLRSALRLEVRGMKRSKGRTAYSIVKSEFGFKGSKSIVLDQLNDWIKKNIGSFYRDQLSMDV